MNILYYHNLIFIFCSYSVTEEWSVESQPSNPEARVRFLAGSEILIYILGLVRVLCVQSCIVSGSGPGILLTTTLRISYIQYISTVLTQSLWSLAQKNLCCKSPGGCNLYSGGG